MRHKEPPAKKTEEMLRKDEAAKKLLDTVKLLDVVYLFRYWFRLKCRNLSVKSMRLLGKVGLRKESL